MKKLGILALLLCVIFLACDEHSRPCPENFNVVELRPDGATFEVNHAVSGDPSQYTGWDISLSLYDSLGEKLAGQIVSPYTNKPRINYNFNKTDLQSFYLVEQAERYDSIKGSIRQTSGKSDLISLTLPQEIPVGAQPVELAIDENSNCVYVSSWFSNSVTKIPLGGTGTPTTTAIGVGINPGALVVNSALQKVYVVNNADNTVSVINGADDSVTTVRVGTFPYFLALNPVTNLVYVSVQDGSNTVAVINSLTDQLEGTIPAQHPGAIAINSQTNSIYVANTQGNSVTLIDGATNATTAIPVGTDPAAIAVNEQTNKIYVANSGSNNVTVIDGITQQITTVPVGESPSAIAVNPSTNKIYVANTETGTVSVIDGVSLAVNNIAVGIPADTEGDYYPAVIAEKPYAIAIDVARNMIYVANIGSANVTAIDGTTNKILIMKSTGLFSRAVAVNSTTGEIFTVNAAARDLDGHGTLMRSFPVIRTPHK